MANSFPPPSSYPAPRQATEIEKLYSTPLVELVKKREALQPAIDEMQAEHDTICEKLKKKINEQRMIDQIIKSRLRS